MDGDNVADRLWSIVRRLFFATRFAPGARFGSAQALDLLCRCAARRVLRARIALAQTIYSWCVGSEADGAYPGRRCADIATSQHQPPHADIERQ
jgi:hypothetical protein